ncbi:hypothetical protein J7M22_12910 [Candidatus Poribacteria bacterium]|nr:hypothetical protein [Candidatus Poribacteria bacterium]
MKKTLGVILLLSIALPSFAELTQRDLDKISALIDRKLEPIKMDIAELKGEIKAVRAEMRGMATKDDIVALKGEISEIKGRMNAMASKDDLIELEARTTARIDALTQAIIAMAVAIFVAILGTIVGGPIFAQWWQKRQEQKEAIRQIREKAQDLVKDHPELAEIFRSIGLI